MAGKFVTARARILLSIFVSLACIASGGEAADAVPTDMLAFRLHEFGGPEGLSLDRVPVPKPATGQVLVHVKAAGVNPGDWKLATGRMGLTPPLPYIMGGEFSGVIDSLGIGVKGWRKGDAVIGYVGFEHGGAEAEYIAIDIGQLAKKPKSVSFAQAAAAPVALLTAWKSLFEIGQLKRGQRVLIHGAAGAVGSVAVQMAKQAGAEVIGTAAGRDRNFLMSLGASRMIDYKTEKFESVLHDIDLVIDGVGGDTTMRSLAVMRQGGLLVALSGVPDSGKCTSKGLRCVFNDTFIPATAELPRLADQLGRRRLKVYVAQEVPFAQAPIALESVRTGGRGDHGRTVLIMP